jgi:hypothetical protein
MTVALFIGTTGFPPKEVDVDRLVIHQGKILIDGLNSQPARIAGVMNPDFLPVEKEFSLIRQGGPAQNLGQGIP